MAAATATDWEERVALYREEPRIKALIERMSAASYQADMSLSDEIRTLLAFTARHAKDRVINGPEDLGTAEQILNEINQYRDRSVEIHLSCISAKGEFERALSWIRQILFLKPEVQAKTESVKAAIAGICAFEMENSLSDWTILFKQSEILIKNCKSVYDNIDLQVEVAKQMWFQRQRVDQNADPTAPTGSAAATHGGVPARSGLAGRLNRG